MDFSSSKRNIALLFVITVIAALGVWFFFDKSSLSNGVSKVKNLATMDDPRELVSPLPFDSTPSEYKVRFSAIARNAVESNQVELDNECIMHPPIFKLTKSLKGVMIVNSSDRDRSLTFDGDRELILTPGEKGVVDRSVFERGSGIYGYLCDDGREPAGLIFVE